MQCLYHCGLGFVLGCCRARAEPTVCYCKPFLFISLRKAGKPWLVCEELSLPAFEEKEEAFEEAAVGVLQERKRKKFPKNQIYNWQIWPMGPKKSKCICPQPLCSAFLRSFLKHGISSRIDQTLSCAVRCKAAKIKFTSRATNLSFP